MRNCSWLMNSSIYGRGGSSGPEIFAGRKDRPVLFATAPHLWYTVSRIHRKGDLNRMTIQEAQKNMEEAIRQTPEFQEYQKAKDTAFADSLSAQLLTEYGRLQNKLQMFAVTGRQAEESEMERFKQLGGLLFATPVTGAYLMAQLRVQKLLADIFADLSKAAGITIELPSLS